MAQFRFLIASSSLASKTHNRIGQELSRRGHSHVLYLADRVLAGEDDLRVEVDRNGKVTAFYNSVDIGPAAVSAAWFWKVSHLSLYKKGEIERDMSIEAEVARWNQTFWALYDSNTWLNSPSSIADGERKLQQLLIARRVGFTTPRTAVTSRWTNIKPWLNDDGESEVRLVVKMFRGLFAAEGSLRCTFTKPLSRSDIEQMESQAVPFPGIFQPYIEKKREWRVTIVGDNVFAASIYTSAEAKDDWRRLQLTDAVRFQVDALPENISALCKQYLRALGLRFGAFDLIETPESEFIFLECNPVGQYGWLEDSLGLQISLAIVDELVTIAARRSK